VATVDYYFDTNHASALWTTTPAYMIDNILTNYASTTVDNQIQTLIGNTCLGTNLGTISAVEIRAYGYGDADDQMIITPIFTGGIGNAHTIVPGVTAEWKAYQDITNDINSPETLYEKYDTGIDGDMYAYGDRWIAQTFTPSTAHSIEYVKIKVFRQGLPGTITVSIRATTDGLPSGADLTSATFNGNVVTTGSVGAWVKVALTPYSLSASTKYAIVIRVLNGDVSNFLDWKRDVSASTYAGGAKCGSTNGGIDWIEDTPSDFAFKEGNGEWTWTNVDNLDMDMELNDVSAGNDMYCSKVEIRVTYTEAGVQITKVISEVLNVSELKNKLRGIIKVVNR